MANVTHNPEDILQNAQPKRITEPIVARTRRTISRANIYQARVNRCTAAMMVFIEYVYERRGGHFINIDSDNDGILLITAPHTKTGWRDYLIRKAEGKALNKIFMVTMKLDTPYPWLTFDPLATSWFVDVKAYRNEKQAKAWLKAINLDERFMGAWKQVTAEKYGRTTNERK